MAITQSDLTFTPTLKVVNEHQLRALHHASLEVLERTGIKMTHPRGREILDGAGARVVGDRVRIPAWLVESALRQAPSRLVLGDRDGKRAIQLQGANSYFGPSLDCLDYLDPATGKRVPFTSEHCAVTARLCELLPNFDWSMVIGMGADLPPQTADRHIARIALGNCKHPLVFCANDLQGVKDIYQMALAICGGKERFDQAPLLVHYSEPISPLTYYDPAVDKALFCAENRIPLIILSAPQACATSPATFAGTIVQGNAESLSGLVLAQAASPGTPFVYGSQTTIMDMRSTIFSYGAAEMSLMISVMGQLAQFYEIPFYATAGSTDARFLDPQAAVEATMQVMNAAAVGSSLVHDCSSWMDHGTLVSPEYMVLVNEILHMVHQFMRGLEITPETMAVDLIDKVGPGGNYLQERHTLANFRKVHYSDLFDRSMIEKWQAAGSRQFGERLRAKTLKLMAQPTEPLAAEVVKELDALQAGWGK